MEKCTVVILAAGEGTRMQSTLPKVMHKAAGLPMVERVVRASVEATGQKPILVYGSGGNTLPEYFKDRCAYALQSERRGSGHAAMMAKEEIKNSGSDYAIILAGDMPLIQAGSIKMLLEKTISGGYACMLLTGRLKNPTGYGRIVRDEAGEVACIVEESDATDVQKLITEVNISVYCFRVEHLLSVFSELKPNNKKNEYYLTDAIEILKNKGLKVGGTEIGDMSECEGVNDRIQLARASEILRERINTKILQKGVTLIDPSHTYIDDDVTIGRDTCIYPGVVIEGKSSIGCGAVLYPGTRIENSIIGDGAIIEMSSIVNSMIQENAKISLKQIKENQIQCT